MAVARTTRNTSSKVSHPLHGSLRHFSAYLSALWPRDPCLAHVVTKSVVMLFSRGAVATAVLRRSFRPSAASVTSRSSSAAVDRLFSGGLATNSSTTSNSASSFSTTAPILQAHSFDEPNPSLFQSDRFAGAALDADVTADDLVADIAAADLDALLRSDVRTMGSLLGNIIQERNGKDIFDKVEKLRNLAKVRFD